MKIAIIGMGISGASTLKSLIDSGAVSESDQVDIFEPRKGIGTGFAYQEDEDTLLMNSYSTRLSLNEENPNEYIEWLRHHFPEYSEDDFSPRHIFGLYLRDKFETYISTSYVNHIQERVIDLEIRQVNTKNPRDYQYIIRTEQNVYSDYEYLFMTIGHPPYADYYDLIKSEQYIHNPYPLSKTLKIIDKQDRVGIIGSSLTAIDITHALMDKCELEAPINLYSRYQPFTNVKNKLYTNTIHLTMDESWIEQEKNKYQGSIPLVVMWEKLKDDFQQNGVNILEAIDKYQIGSVSAMRRQTQETPLDLQIIQRYVGLLTAYLPSLNMALTPADRQTFHTKYKWLFEHFRTQFPAIKMNLMHQWLENGHIRFITGLKDIRVTDQQTFMIETREGYQHTVDKLINATGFQMNLAQAAKIDPLIAALYHREIITQHSLGGIQISWPGSHPLSLKYGEIHTMVLSGAWIFTTQFGNNNAQMTARHGKFMAENFLKYRKTLS